MSGEQTVPSPTLTQPLYFKVPLGGEQLMMFGLRKRLPQRQLIDLAFLRMRETGLMGHVMEKYFERGHKCQDFGQSSFKPVAFVYVKGAVYILLGGFIVSIALFVVEHILHWSL